MLIAGKATREDDSLELAAAQGDDLAGEPGLFTYITVFALDGEIHALPMPTGVEIPAQPSEEKLTH